MANVFHRIVTHHTFHRVVLGLIVLNAVIMGLETWPSIAARWGDVFRVAHVVIQAAFVTEVAMRIAACGRRPLAFFRDGWNVFDFLVVVLAMLPAAGPFATVARLARILRVARMVTGIPELRLIIGTLLKSIPSMAHVVLLASLLIYIYGVVGTHLFAEVDPERWGTLGRAAHTLFVIITLEGWVELMQTSTQATSWAWLYYASFIVIAVFVVTNLFIAVVINNLETVRNDKPDAAASRDSEIERLTAKVDELLAEIRSQRR
ncbi:MAG: ion transporter [Myxococcota bacterium]|nr:ion transporter [Deltaproteobacteria bacterium]MDQ3336986.1 ion transporter [Myxococcota bacterium]